jgi:Protein of unknown function (DUF2442)
MTSVLHGAATSLPTATDFSPEGFKLLLDGESFFVPFSRFPWFRGVDAIHLQRVTRPSAQHLCWPDLDVDLSLASLRDPEAFPLVSGLGLRTTD